MSEMSYYSYTFLCIWVYIYMYTHRQPLIDTRMHTHTILILLSENSF